VIAQLAAKERVVLRAMELEQELPRTRDGARLNAKPPATATTTPRLALTARSGDATIISSSVTGPRRDGDALRHVHRSPAVPSPIREAPVNCALLRDGDVQGAVGDSTA
jgi:hypothetical protein